MKSLQETITSMGKDVRGRVMSGFMKLKNPWKARVIEAIPATNGRDWLLVVDGTTVITVHKCGSNNPEALAKFLLLLCSRKETTPCDNTSK